MFVLDTVQGSLWVVTRQAPAIEQTPWEEILPGSHFIVFHFMKEPLQPFEVARSRR